MSVPQIAGKNRPGSVHNPWRLLKGTTLLLLCVVQAGCAFARLEGVLKRERAASTGEIQGVEVMRDGARVPPGLRMELEKGDEIRTDGETTVTVSFAGGSEIILRPGTHIRILNPSILALLGEVFIKVQGVFQVETEYVTAGAEGTEYLVTLRRDDEVSVVVLDGVVRVESKARRWRPVSLGKLEQGTIRRQEIPQRSRVGRERVNEIIHWVNRVEQLSHADTGLLMPNVVGLPEMEGRRRIDRGQPIAVIVKKRVTGRDSIGTIVDQSVPAGERVARGASVVLGVEAEPVRVPSFMGRRVEQAKRMIQRERLFLGKVTERITGKAAAGTVIYQNPRPRSVVAAGSAVDLVIEEESVAVPNLVKRHINQARQMLLDAELRVGQTREDLTERAKAGTVLSQNPRSGTRVGLGTTVDLVIAAAGVRVPKVTGLNLRQAQLQVNRVGLNVGRTQRDQSPRYAAGTVMEQVPAPGALVRTGTSIDLVVSTGPPECVVPNVLKLTYERARTRLENAGFRVGRVSRIGSGNLVSQQDPDPRTKHRCNSTVNLWIGIIQ